MKIKVKKVHKDAIIPTKEVGSVGYDLYACEEVTLRPSFWNFPPSQDVPADNANIEKVCTGIALEIPHGHVGLIWDRSSMGSKGIHRLAGVIDPNFRGELKVVLVNLSLGYYKIKKGDRVAQLIIQKVDDCIFEEVKELSDTNRGTAGFGSSGT